MKSTRGSGFRVLARNLEPRLTVGVSHKKVEFTTYILNPGVSDPTLILELRWSF